ncbi:MAG TPA: hypothetical protein DEQ02_08075 [Ruminococcaceae bacterium]|nr:hypothetical protein [Oscillospiraceae bacterium]
MVTAFANILGHWTELKSGDAIEGTAPDDWFSSDKEKAHKGDYVNVIVGGYVYHLHKSLIVDRKAL